MQITRPEKPEQEEINHTNKLNLRIRYELYNTNMDKKEYPLLKDFLYEAIYIPDGVKAPPISVIVKKQNHIF